MKNTKLLKTIVIILFFICLLLFGSRYFLNYFFNRQIVEVPNVINLQKNEAKKLIKAAGLKVEFVSSSSNSSEYNSAFIQYPEAGKKVKVRRRIKVWINDGTVTVVPKAIIGLDLNDGLDILNKMNIRVKEKIYTVSNKKAGTILNISPSPGTELKVNQEVVLTVSTRQEVDKSIMPDLKGKTLDDAMLDLKSYNLSLGEIRKAESDLYPSGTIISTTPSFGKKITEKESVSLVVSTGGSVIKDNITTKDLVKKENKKNEEIENIINETLKNIEEKEKIEDNASNSDSNNDKAKGSKTEETNKNEKSDSNKSAEELIEESLKNQ